MLITFFKFSLIILMLTSLILTLITFFKPSLIILILISLILTPFLNLLIKGKLSPYYLYKRKTSYITPLMLSLPPFSLSNNKNAFVPLFINNNNDNDNNDNNNNNNNAISSSVVVLLTLLISLTHFICF
jgi:hypothetical protein